MKETHITIYIHDLEISDKSVILYEEQKRDD